MLTTEHVQTAQDFLVASEREFLEGDVLQGAEKLWGATAHAVMAIAVKRGWPHNSHQALKRAASKIANELEDPSLEMGFGLAEKFHRHFYHDSMEEFERRIDGRHVRNFVQRLLEIE